MRNQRGQIILFVMLSLCFLLVVAGGLGSDAAKLIAAKGEVQASLDAAALAGAGKLGFDATAFPAARAFAMQFALANKTRTGDVVLDSNDANDWQAFDGHTAPYGDVTLGVWDPDKPEGVGAGQRFEPSLDGTRVNAVMCRYKKKIKADWLSLWSFFPMNVAGVAIATANPPSTPPPTSCLVPIGLSDCPFNASTSMGCGVPITFISSQPVDGNTAAWVNLGGTGQPSVPVIQQQITEAGSGTCPGTGLKTGDLIGADNGMKQPAVETLVPIFKSFYDASTGDHIVLTNSAGDEVYNGPGWDVFTPIIHTDCPPQGINRDVQITGWTRFVITQIIDKGECVVANHWPGNDWDHRCPAPNGTSTERPEKQLRAIFGYYACSRMSANPVTTPLPRSALAIKLRLVR
jgi:hypothetical protein